MLHFIDPDDKRETHITIIIISYVPHLLLSQLHDSWQKSLIFPIAPGAHFENSDHRVSQCPVLIQSKQVQLAMHLP